MEVISWFLISLTLVTGIRSQSPTVTIDQGTLQGRVMLNRLNGSFYGFQGVPYGRPPVNELRFKAPQPADGWEGIRLAIADGMRCIQHSVLPLGEEDCLYLNVYTPSLPSEDDSLKPVMVWIHGGGFNIGSGGTLIYGPEFIMTEDVVLVTVNYRLGVFGFLSLDDPELGFTGNAGLKDQSLALRWVRENIVRFNGDPNNVCIFGESAGGASVHLHMLSPMSAGLFDKVIAQSGNAMMGGRGVRNTAVVLARALNIQTENYEEMMATLQAVDPAEILSNALGLTRFNPLVEVVTSDEPTFITDYPFDLIERGEYAQVPFLIGVNDKEGLLVQIEERITNEQNITVENFGNFVPWDLNADPDSVAEIEDRIKRFYFGDEEPTRENIIPTVQLYTDFSFAFPAVRATVEHMRTMQQPLYFYLFTADTRLNLLKHIDETTTNIPGAAHADELGYLFYNDLIPVDIEEGSWEEFGLERIVKLWTNFARYSDPTPSNWDMGDVWLPLEQNNDFRHLHFATSYTTMTDGMPLPERMQFWFDLYSDFSGGKK